MHHILHINEFAVGSHTKPATGRKIDFENINPGAKSSDIFASTTLDDYVSNNLNRVDFIKMDIEGAEMGALKGGMKTIEKYKPKLNL